MLTRTKELLGAGVNKLVSAKVMVVGVGGVGGAVAECLVRTGIGEIILVDGDVINKSNLNRQIFTYEQNIGKFKVQEMAKRIKLINPNCNVVEICEFVSKTNAINFAEMKVDYIVDCIDDIPAKIELIKTAKSLGNNVISAMGAGNRIGLPNFAIMDIYKTSYDPLAKIFRKKLRENGIENLDVCVSTSPVDIKQSPPASVMWQPLTCGAVISAYVVDKICKN